MAAIDYTSLFPEVLPHATGLPRTIAVQEIRNTVIDICKEAGVWQHVFDPINSVVDKVDYYLPLASLEAPAEMHRPVWVLYEGKRLQPISFMGLEQKYPDWREGGRHGNKPIVFVQKNREIITIVPKPSVGLEKAIIVRVELKPTRSSHTTDREIFEEYHELIINGTLARLLQQPNQTWTNGRAAQSYGARYIIQRDDAKEKAMGNNQGILRTVNYGGIDINSGISQRDSYREDYYNQGGYW